MISKNSIVGPTVIDGRTDNFEWKYEDQKDVITKYKGQTTQVNLNTPNTNYFKSDVAKTVFNMQS